MIPNMLKILDHVCVNMDHIAVIEQVPHPTGGVRLRFTMSNGRVGELDNPSKEMVAALGVPEDWAERTLVIVPSLSKAS